MNVFLTGGTGYFGSVLVEQLLAAGHHVTGLARTDASAQKLSAAGVAPVRGSLADVDVLQQAAAEADAVVHAAVDYAQTEEAAATELAAVAALVEGAGSSGTAKPLLYTSTGLVYGFGSDRDVTEDSVLPEVSAQPVKVAAERLVLTESRITGTVVRAGLIFGRGGTGLVTGLITSAATNGVATYVGDGENSWLPVHVDDLADLYVRALENPTPGIFNAVGSVRFTFRELAGAIGDLTGTPPTSVPLEAAEAAFGPAARILTTTSRLTAAKAVATFGWAPSDASLIDDVRSGSYTAPGA